LTPDPVSAKLSAYPFWGYKQAGGIYGLLIGINQYAVRLYDLEDCHNDVEKTEGYIFAKEANSCLFSS